MPGEKQNSIKQKLDQMQTIPNNLQFDENRAWQKLEATISTRSKRKILLWLPAAALLIMLVTNFLFVNKNRPVIKMPVAAVIQQPGKETLVQKTIIAENNTTLVRVEKVPLRNNAVLQDKPEIPKKDTSVGSFETEKVPIETSPLISSTDTVAMVTTLQKPKFKIAHINELYSPQLVPQASAKTGVAFSLWPSSSGIADEPLTPEEKITVQKKQKTFLSSLLSSSQ